MCHGWKTEWRECCWYARITNISRPRFLWSEIIFCIPFDFAFFFLSSTVCCWMLWDFDFVFVFYSLIFFKYFFVVCILGVVSAHERVQQADCCSCEYVKCAWTGCIIIAGKHMTHSRNNNNNKNEEATNNERSYRERLIHHQSVSCEHFNLHAASAKQHENWQPTRRQRKRWIRLRIRRRRSHRFQVSANKIAWWLEIPSAKK